MFCPNCGKQIEEDSVFCEYCGCRIQPEQDAAVPEAVQTVSSEPKAPKDPSEWTKKLRQFLKENKKVVGISGGVLAVVIVVAIIIAVQPTTIHLNKYLIATYDGYDTVGTASYGFDYDAFYEDYLGKIKWKKAGKLSQGDAYDACDELLDLCVDGSLDRTKNLSNGDKIIFTWDCSDEEAKGTFGVRLSHKDKKLKVEGLKEPEKVNPFENLDVTFSGTEPYGQCQLVQHTEKLEYLPYRVVPSGGLKNGDTVTVSLPDVDTEEGQKNYLRNYGIIFTETEKTYTVEGLQEVRTIDPFEKLEFHYSGISPYGELEISNQSEEDCMSDLNFNVNPHDNVKNGDTITITVSGAYMDDKETEQYLNQKYGVALSKTQTTVEAEGMDAYVTELSQISETAFGEMKKQAEDTLRAKAAKDWDDEVSLDGATYLGSYFLTAKTPNFYRKCDNMLYLVYQVQCSADFHEDGLHEDGSYYYTVQFRNLIVEPDGTVRVDLSDYRPTSNRITKQLADHGYYFYGYNTLEDAFTNCVTKSVDEYSYESNVEAE